MKPTFAAHRQYCLSITFPLYCNLNSPFVPGNFEKFPLCSPELLLEAFLLLENEEAGEKGA